MYQTCWQLGAPDVASYAFIKIKLASCHLLLYVVYVVAYAKNYKILYMHDAFNCLITTYKQK